MAKPQKKSTKELTKNLEELLAKKGVREDGKQVFDKTLKKATNNKKSDS